MNNNKILRQKLFRHLDGIVIGSTAYILKTIGITDFLLKHKQASLHELVKKFSANEGYLNVALRGLCTQGWLNQIIDNTKDSERKKVLEYFKYYHETISSFADQKISLLAERVKMNKEGEKGIIELI